MLTLTTNWEATQIAFPRTRNYSKRGNMYRQGEIFECFNLMKHGGIKLHKNLQLVLILSSKSPARNKFSEKENLKNRSQSHWKRVP